MEQTQPKILLVDESRFFLTIEKQFLRNLPITILDAQSSTKTLEICRTERPQLIYLAQEVAGQTGAECCLQIKADPELRSIPVIMICEPGEEKVCHLAGCDAILLKPLEKNRFLEIGRSFLAGIRERRRSCLVSVKAQCPLMTIEARGLDISSGGVFLESSAQLPVGTLLQLDIHLARPHESGPRIECTGQLAWLNTRDNPRKPNHPVGLGIKFIELSTPAASILNGYLHAIEQ